MPLLARLFSLADFGNSETCLLGAAFVALVAAGQMESAVMIPKEDSEASLIMVFVMWCTLCSSALFLGVALFWPIQVASVLGNINASPWIASSTAVMATTVLYRAMTLWNNRHRRFPAVSASRVIRAAVSVAAPIPIFFLVRGPVGLIYGQAVGNFIAILWLLYKSPRSEIRGLFFAPRGHIFEVVRKHSGFFKYTSFGSLINAIGNRLPSLMLGRYYGANVLGEWAVCQRAVAVPTAALSQTMGEVYYREASHEANETGNCAKSWDWGFKRIVLLGLGPLTVLGLGGPTLFPAILGHKWQMAGVMAAILAPSMMADFVATPLSLSFFVMHKQVWNLIWQIAMTGVFLIAIFFSLRTHSPYWLVGAYAISNVVMMSLNLVTTRFLSRSQRLEASDARVTSDE